MASSSASAYASSLNQSSLPILLLLNVCNLVSIKLDSTNYSLWHHQIVSILYAHKLFGFVDGSSSQPGEFLRNSAGQSSATSKTRVPNPVYADWVAQDRAITALINATLSPSTLSLVVGCKTAHETWLRIKTRFTALSRSHIMQIRTFLQNLRKKPNKSIDMFFQRAKELKDRLANASVDLDDEEMLIYILTGLPAEYSSFRTSIRVKTESITLEHLQSLLQTEETTIENQHKSTENLMSSSAMLSLHRSTDSSRGNFRARGCFNGSFGNRGHGRSSFNLQNRSNNNLQNIGRRFCQICKRFGHEALDCFHRMDYSYQGHHPPAQLSAMAANYNTGNNASDSSVWLADSGCNAHVAHDASLLTSADPCTSDSQIAVGDGQGISIQHTGKGLLPTPNFTFQLPSIFHAPSMAANLLSVHKLCLDNHCSVIFTADPFKICDLLTHKVLFQGPSKNDLYPLPSSSTLYTSRSSSTQAFFTSKVSSNSWHSRLGHTSDKILKIVLDKNNVSFQP